MAWNITNRNLPRAGTIRSPLFLRSEEPDRPSREGVRPHLPGSMIALASLGTAKLSLLSMSSS